MNPEPQATRNRAQICLDTRLQNPSLPNAKSAFFLLQSRTSLYGYLKL
jgi:hypothetical protein